MKPSRWKRGLLIAFCALVAVPLGLLVGARLCSYAGVGGYTYYGWHTNKLSAGRVVALAQDFYGEPPGDRILAPKSSHCIVIADPAGDEDDCRADRLIAVEFDGQKIEVPRKLLH